ncbi:hypothetical protein GH714_031544 [Hevea brasiliensis]|uniref:Dof-type domain-containing protein n=1 Tax=Hevea brasiliensis TaxID=3981 RepID=A0A6A6LE73_HEVBR|nr:hypothetical protein GH714_031544 [Hevea brasiliensis]
MDTAQCPQGTGLARAMESSRPTTLERKVRPQKDQALNCPSGSKTHNLKPSSSSSLTPSHHVSAMELLKTGMSTRGLDSFISMPVVDSNTVYSTEFSLQEFKPTHNFFLEGFESSHGYESIQGVQENGARLLFPMEDLKPVQGNTDQYDQNKGQGDHTTGFWNGMY